MKKQGARKLQPAAQREVFCFPSYNPEPNPEERLNTILLAGSIVAPVYEHHAQRLFPHPAYC